MKHFLLSVLFVLITFTGFSQCPPNIDFEQNNFSGWVCKSGKRGASSPITTTPTTTGVIPGRQTLTSSGVDPFGGFPTVAPLGGLHSLRLGNSRTNDSCESVEYKLTVPNQNTFYLTYLYAIVLNAPCTSHSFTQQPFYYITAIDSATGHIIACDSLMFSPCNGTSINSSFGFLQSIFNANGDPVIYKPWSQGTIKITGYQNRTVIIRAMTGDCTLSGHFGYGYFDILANCSLPPFSSGFCPGTTQAGVNGPSGFQSYVWMDSAYTVVLGSGQNTTIPISPTQTDSFMVHVIITPFPGLGCPDTLSGYVTPKPKPTIKLYNDTLICAGTSATLTAVGNNLLSFNWTPNVGSTQSVVVNPTTQTTYSVTTTNSFGCSSSDTVIVSIKNLTIVSSTPTIDNVCQGSNIFLAVDSTTSGTIWPYVWVANNNPFNPGSSASIVIPINNTDTIAVIAHDINGCRDTIRYFVTAQSLPSSSFNYTSDICVGTHDTLKYIGNINTTLGYPNSYIVWSLNGNAIGTIPFQNWNQPIHPTVGGVYNYNAVVVDSNGCWSNTTHTVTVHSPDKPYIYGLDSLCSTDSVLLWVSPVNLQYLWSNGKTTDSIYVHTSGTYKVYMTNQWGCVDSTKKKIVYFNPPIANAGNDTTILIGNSVDLNASGSIGSVYYEWSISSNQIITNISPTTDTMIILEVRNDKGCYDKDTILIHVLQCRPPMVPNAFSPNGDGLDDVFKIMNTEDFTTIHSFMIFNRWGQMIYNTNDKLKGWDGKYNGIEQEIGAYVYLIIASCNSGKIQRKGDLILIR
jgi:gliding motility-associated-like protein